MNSKLLLSLLLSFMFIGVFAQKDESQKNITTETMTYTHVPSIADQLENGTFVGVDRDRPMHIGNAYRKASNKTVPYKGFPKGDDPLIEFQKNPAYKIKNKAASLVFDAATVTTYIPSDPTGAVGPNHYLGGWNAGFRVFDKTTGAPLMPEASLSTLFGAGENDGDPIMLYDADADRFIITEFYGWNFPPPPTSPWGFFIAISDSPNPVTSGWHVYNFVTTNFPDYPKYSIWHDGYYITANISGTNKVFVLERDKMLTGDSTAQFVGLPLSGINTNAIGFYSPQVFNIGNTDFPTTGDATAVYLQDDSWTGVTTDHLKLWSIHVDWSNIASSVVTSLPDIATAAFNSVFDGGLSSSNLSQPAGPDIDALQATIMNQAQFRKFPSYNSAIFNFVVDTDGSTNELAGIRWYELRQTAAGQPWTIYQEGTYVAPSGKHAFNASMIMDSEGNIGMGYSTVSTSEHIAVNYTGRYATDPLNYMSLTEQEIVQGGFDNDLRYSDYSHLTIDPADDTTFWYISEYFNPQRTDVVGVFDLANTHHNDLGVVQINTPFDGLLGNEYIGITIKNYGHNAQSGVTLSYQVDSGTIVYDVYSGTIPSGAAVPFIFSTPSDMSTAGQTYSITASTQLTSDQDISNDAFTKDVTHLYPDDIGITAVTAPVSGNMLGIENITATIENFGANPQTMFDVIYYLNGEPIPFEPVPLTLNPGSTTSYTFTAQGNFSAFDDHNLQVSTLLAGDMNIENDVIDVIITNTPCTRTSNVISQVIPTVGNIQSLIHIPFTEVVSDINVNINLYHSRDADLDISLIAPDGTEVELTSDNGGTGHDYVNTYFDDDASTPITSGSAPFTATYSPEGNLSDFNGLNSIGNWILSITDDTSNGHGGTLVSWDLDLCFDPDIDIYEDVISAENMIINAFDNNQFIISLETEKYKDPLIITVYSITGQKLAENWVKKEDNSYSYDLDMSYVSSGVYLIRYGNESFGMVRRIIVK